MIASVDHILAAFPDVRLVRSDSDLGYAGGNELALKVALANSEAELF